MLRIKKYLIQIKTLCNKFLNLLLMLGKATWRRFVLFLMKIYLKLIHFAIYLLKIKIIWKRVLLFLLKIRAQSKRFATLLSKVKATAKTKTKLKVKIKLKGKWNQFAKFLQVNIKSEICRQILKIKKIYKCYIQLLFNIKSNLIRAVMGYLTSILSFFKSKINSLKSIVSIIKQKLQGYDYKTLKTITITNKMKNLVYIVLILSISLMVMTSYYSKFAYSAIPSTPITPETLGTPQSDSPIVPTNNNQSKLKQSKNPISQSSPTKTQSDHPMTSTSAPSISSETNSKHNVTNVNSTSSNQVTSQGGIQNAPSQAPSTAVQSLSADPEFELPVYVMIRAKEYTTLSSETAALVKSITKREGDSFKKDDVLIEFDCRVQESELNKALAQQKLTRSTLESATKLKSYGSISDSEHTKAEAEAEIANADVNKLSAIVDKCTIKAPYNGSVAESLVHIAESVKPGDPMLKIVNVENLELNMQVPSIWLRWLHIDSSFKVTINELNKTVSAKVIKINPEINPVSQTVKIIGVLTENVPELLPGMSGQAVFPDKMSFNTFINDKKGV